MNDFLLLYLYLGMCIFLCVLGVCIVKDKCICDRGFEGLSCNDIVIEGKFINVFFCEWCGS